MKSFTVATILAIAAPALAQSYLDLPTCAQPATLAALGSTGCTLTDIACVCRNSGFVAGLIQTIPGVCSPADTASALTIATQLCAANGVTLSIPANALPSATAPGSSAAASTTTAILTSTSVIGTVTSVTSLTSSSAPAAITSTPVLNSTSTVVFANSTTTTSMSTDAVTLTTGTLTRQSTATRSVAPTTSSAVPANGAVAQNVGLFGLVSGLLLAMAGAL